MKRLLFFCIVIQFISGCSIIGLSNNDDSECVWEFKTISKEKIKTYDEDAETILDKEKYKEREVYKIYIRDIKTYSKGGDIVFKKILCYQ